MAQAVNRECYRVAGTVGFASFDHASARTICNTRCSPRISIAPMTVNSDVGDRLVIMVMDCDRHEHTPILTGLIYKSVQIANMHT